MLVNLLARTAAPGLIAPAEVANPGAGAQFQFTIWTDDVDAACGSLPCDASERIERPIHFIATSPDWSLQLMLVHLMR